MPRIFMGAARSRSLLAAALLLCSLCATAAPRHKAVPRNVNLAPDAATLQLVAARLQSPVPGAAVSSGFGGRRHPTLRRARFHGGLDFGARTGTPVLAAGEGVVESIGRARDHGLYVILRHGERLRSGYSHLSAVAGSLKAGDLVAAGEQLGNVGRSGRASGSHLHFEVFVDGRRVDPRLALAEPVPASL